MLRRRVAAYIRRPRELRRLGSAARPKRHSGMASSGRFVLHMSNASTCHRNVSMELESMELEGIDMSLHPQGPCSSTGATDKRSIGAQATSAFRKSEQHL